jgi:predicted transcriptional regulator
MSDTLIPKFIPLYPSVLQHYGVVESSILGYLDFFQYYNKDFNCTNEDLSKILNVSERTVATAIKNLSKG